MGMTWPENLSSLHLQHQQFAIAPNLIEFRDNIDYPENCKWREYLMTTKYCYFVL